MSILRGGGGRRGMMFQPEVVLEGLSKTARRFNTIARGNPNVSVKDVKKRVNFCLLIQKIRLYNE